MSLGSQLIFRRPTQKSTNWKVDEYGTDLFSTSQIFSQILCSESLETLHSSFLVAILVRNIQKKVFNLKTVSEENLGAMPMGRISKGLLTRCHKL